jgi:hypothetical protein
MTEYGSTMTTSDWLSCAAILVAALSSVYARWAWSESHKANQISLHAHKKSIYDAFFELKMHMVQKARFAETEHVQKFYYGARNARFYFDKKIADKLRDYYEQCFYIAELNLQKTAKAELPSLIDEAIALSDEIERLISEDIKLSD